MSTTVDAKSMHWDKLGDRVQFLELLQAGLKNVAVGLSEMVGRPISIATSNVQSLSVGQVPEWLGDPETEMVGVYLLIDGDINGQAILILSLNEALHLIDLLGGGPTGTTTEFADLGRSALAETGNLAASYFINEVARQTGTELRPSPPAVMVDMLGAIFNVVSSPVAAMSDDLLIVEAEFRAPDRTVTAHFWYCPIRATSAASSP
jgi:chemotaxis protein CheC